MFPLPPRVPDERSTQKPFQDPLRREKLYLRNLRVVLPLKFKFATAHAQTPGRAALQVHPVRCHVQIQPILQAPHGGDSFRQVEPVHPLRENVQHVDQVEES